MKKITTLLLVVVSIVALTGCGSPVPGNHISGALGGVPFDIKNPKQFNAKGFDLALDAGTNHFKLHFDEMTSQNDPQVIDKSYAGQAAVLDAQGRFMDKLGSTFGSFIGATGGTAAKTMK